VSDFAVLEIKSNKIFLIKVHFSFEVKYLKKIGCQKNFYQTL